MYREIFAEQCYTPHGVDGGAADLTVVDAGMNLGLFCLFLHSRGVRGTCLAFEPAPETYALAVRNMRDAGITVIEHGSELPAPSAASERPHDGLLVHAFQLALGSKPFGQKASFTFYPYTSANSSFSELEADSSLEGADAETLEVTCCRLSEALSAVFESSSAPGHRVDLLKVDVEGAEQEVFEGLLPADVERLGDLAVETSQELATRLTEDLEAAGYKGSLSTVQHPECKGQWLLHGRAAAARSNS